MTRRGTAQLVLVCAALLASISASAAQPAPEADPVRGAPLTSLVRSTDLVQPVAVTLAPAASATAPQLPPVPVTLSRDGIPGRALAAYRAASDAMERESASCRLTWPLLAAIGFVESAHGSVHGGAVQPDGRVTPPVLGPRLDGSGAYALINDSDGGALDGDSLLDRAVGPMQFIPSTWKHHRADGDGDGRADPHDLDDAALAAGRYLCAGDRRLDQPAGAIAAVFSYNHSYDYVRVVLTAAARYAGQPPAQWGVDSLPAPAPAVAASPSPLLPSPSPVAGASPGPAPPSLAPSPGEPTPAPTPGEQAEPEPQPEPAMQPTPEPTQEPEPERTEAPPGR